MDDLRAFFARHGIYRSRDRKWVAGVCVGLGKRYGLSPKAARLVFVLGLLLVPGSQVVIYPLLWVLVPREGWTPAAVGPPQSYS